MRFLSKPTPSCPCKRYEAMRDSRWACIFASNCPWVDRPCCSCLVNWAVVAQGKEKSNCLGFFQKLSYSQIIFFLVTLTWPLLSAVGSWCWATRLADTSPSRHLMEGELQRCSWTVLMVPMDWTWSACIFSCSVSNALRKAVSISRFVFLPQTIDSIIGKVKFQNSAPNQWLYGCQIGPWSWAPKQSRGWKHGPWYTCEGPTLW